MPFPLPPSDRLDELRDVLDVTPLLHDDGDIRDADLDLTSRPRRLWHRDSDERPYRLWCRQGRPGLARRSVAGAVVKTCSVVWEPSPQVRVACWIVAPGLEAGGGWLKRHHYILYPPHSDG